jgi:hypothetical protein
MTTTAPQACPPADRSARKDEQVEKFDAWMQNPYTKVLQASIENDYVPRADVRGVELSDERSVPRQFFIDMDSYLRHIECFGSDEGKKVADGIRQIGKQWLSAASAPEGGKQ